jgi:hypothetical protein
MINANQEIFYIIQDCVAAPFIEKAYYFSIKDNQSLSAANKKISDNRFKNYGNIKN